MTYVWIVYESIHDYKNHVHRVETVDVFASEKGARTYCEFHNKEYIYSCAGTIWGYRTCGGMFDDYQEYLTITKKEVKP